MLYLQFKASRSQEATLGSAAGFRVAGNFIRDIDTGEIVARYHNHFWEVAGNHYTGYQCNERLTMHFEDVEGGSTDKYGPFPGLNVADGSAYAEDRLVAKFIDPTLLWHDHQTDTYWPNMILQPA
jgi:hypothetical protein